MPRAYQGWTVKKLIDFEREITEYYEMGLIRSPIHLSGGNEQELINLFTKYKINKNSWLFSTYRSHHHALLKGIDPEWLKQEIIAGRSMHINSKEHNFFTSSIAGGCLPIALGVALAIKMRGEDRRVWCFVGDMAAEMGIFDECSKYAKWNELPVTFVVEDNGFSVNSPTQEVWGQGCKGHIRRYKYERVWPHQGCGQWVAF